MDSNAPTSRVSSQMSIQIDITPTCIMCGEMYEESHMCDSVSPVPSPPSSPMCWGCSESEMHDAEQCETLIQQERARNNYECVNCPNTEFQDGSLICTKCAHLTTLDPELLMDDTCSWCGRGGTFTNPCRFCRGE